MFALHKAADAHECEKQLLHLRITDLRLSSFIIVLKSFKPTNFCKKFLKQVQNAYFRAHTGFRMTQKNIQNYSFCQFFKATLATVDTPSRT